MMVLKE